MEICVIINKCVQVGPENWEMQETTRIFDTSKPIKDIFSWVKSTGIKNPTANDFIIADHTGSSL